MHDVKRRCAASLPADEQTPAALVGLRLLECLGLAKLGLRGGSATLVAPEGVEAPPG